MAKSDFVEPYKEASDSNFMARAIARASHSRLLSPPNPWVGCVIVASDGTSFEGSTQRPGHNHAEVEVLKTAGSKAKGSNVFVTLEPCSHQGQTPPCVDSLIAAQVARVVVGVVDPDPQVSGRGIDRLEKAGIKVEVGLLASEIGQQLAPYLKHRRTGRPYVVVKTAATLDGRTSAADGTSQWITSDAARADVHWLRAESDAVLAGANTVRLDDPQLTVRGVSAVDGLAPRQPLRVVLGKAPAGAKVHPCVELAGDTEEVLEELGRRGVTQLLVEGGATVAGQFHNRGLVDRYVVYLAPALMGGSVGNPMLAGAGATTIEAMCRGSIESLVRLGKDLRIDFVPAQKGSA